jgi:hypothetical protein
MNASQSAMSTSTSSKAKKNNQLATNVSEGAQIIGCELYSKLKAFLESFLSDLQKVKTKLNLNSATDHFIENHFIETKSHLTE